MDQYLKQKIPLPAKSGSEAMIDKERKLAEDLKKLSASKPQMVEDFQKPMVKDLAVDKIDRRGEVLPQVSGSDFQANIEAKRQARKEALSSLGKSAIDEKVLPAGDWKKEFADKARLASRSSAARKLMGVVPFVAPAMALMNGEPAMAAEELAADVSPVYDAIKPTASGPASGSLDDRIEKGMLTDEDKVQLRLQALQQLQK